MPKSTKKDGTMEKHVYRKPETRLPVHDLDELAIDRRRARQTMRNSSRIRWTKFISALQQHRRAAEREVREGRAPSLPSVEDIQRRKPYQERRTERSRCVAAIHAKAGERRQGRGFFAR